MTVLTDFVEKHIDKDWDWGARGLSSNNKITLNFIEKYIDKGWDFGAHGLSSNPHLTLDFLNKYSYKHWDLDWLDYIGFFKFKKLCKNADYDKLLNIWNEEKECLCRSDREHFSRCIDVNKDLESINYDFGVFNLSSNKTVDIDFIEKTIRTYGDKFYWGLYGLSSNPNLTTDFVEKYINKNWHWGAFGLSRYLSMDIKFIEKHKHKLDFDICGLSSNPNLSLDTIIYYMDYLNFDGISHNTNITTKFIEKHIDKKWNWKFISTLTFDKEEPDKSARVIQKALYNWLWKPVCKDGSLGINLRIGLNYLSEINSKCRIHSN